MLNGISGHSNVANMWHDYYKKLLNSTNNTVNMKYVFNKFGNCKVVNFIISQLNIKQAVKSLTNGNSAGLEDVYSE